MSPWQRSDLEDLETFNMMQDLIGDICPHVSDKALTVKIFNSSLGGGSI